MTKQTDAVQGDNLQEEKAATNVEKPIFLKHDQLLVQANRVAVDGGGTKVVSYTVRQNLGEINCTEKDAERANSFEIAHTGKRLFPAGKYKAGETIPADNVVETLTEVDTTVGDTPPPPTPPLDGDSQGAPTV